MRWTEVYSILQTSIQFEQWSMEHLLSKISALTFYTTISVTMVFQSKTKHLSKLSWIFCSLIAEKHFKTMATCKSRCVSLSMFLRPCLQPFGRFHLSLTCVHLLSRDPSMNAWLSPTVCTCRPVFENRPFCLTLHDTCLCTRAFLPDHTTASCSPHHCITTMVFSSPMY